jgi:hypothetical protein
MELQQETNRSFHRLADRLSGAQLSSSQRLRASDLSMRYKSAMWKVHGFPGSVQACQSVRLFC